MNVINHRQFKKKSGGPARHKRRILRVFGVAIGIFVAANILVAITYANKVLPNQTLAGQKIGGANYADVERLIDAYELPATVTVTKNGYSEDVPVPHLDISIQADKTLATVKQKSLLPIFAFFHEKSRPLVLQADNSKVADAILILDAPFSRVATDRRVAFDGNAFVVEDAKAGYTFDADTSAKRIIRALSLGQKSIDAATKTTPPGDNTGDYSSEKAALQRQLNAKVTYSIGTQKIHLSTHDLGNMYEHSGRTMVFSEVKAQAYITDLANKVGIASRNIRDAALATRYAASTSQSISFVLSQPNATKMTYCTTADGVAQTELGDLTGKLAATYGDPRGWNNGGAVAFEYVTTGCDFRVVLAAPARMTSYGAICDNYYNCQVGNNVVVNNDRWLYATEPWKKTGQSLETYRLLIINHETGHRLGLRDYNVCSGPGQPAPVMMQQSVDLMGCNFNVWPLQSELNKL